jgi:hypothetical protein
VEDANDFDDLVPGPGEDDETGTRGMRGEAISFEGAELRGAAAHPAGADDLA